MCGICGIWNNEQGAEADQRVVTRMMDRMRHRGPDEQGLLQTEWGSCGHDRLSIMDPEGGKHPIFNEDRSLAVIANGEIYNYTELRRDLERRHRFATTNDSEVMLHLYEERGEAMLEELDGMFAFCICDGDQLFLARDPIGIKPLYYVLGEDGDFLFTSELKSLEADPGEVCEFPAGSWFHTQEGFRSYYRMPRPELRHGPVTQQAADLRETLERAILERLMSDVPLGSFLSGGLDSSIIAAVAAREIPRLHTFSVGLESSTDLEAARIVAGYIGSTHHEYIMSEKEIFDKLPEIIYHLESFDQDLVRSAIPCYFTSRIASRHVKVILTGEGADELFGGYSYYKQIGDSETLNRELRRSVLALHNINLQRVDRLTMAHSIEGRVPFLDLDMIEFAQTIEADLKLHGTPPVEKWILRGAFETLLPREIVWRDKQQFDEGSGVAALMARRAESFISDSEFETYMNSFPEVYLRSKEEAYYFKLFNQVYPKPDHIMKNVGRWATRPEFSPALR
jgi:asparagine synthase (glutamine-hydrolysing)